MLPGYVTSDRDKRAGGAGQRTPQSPPGTPVTTGAAISCTTIEVCPTLNRTLDALAVGIDRFARHDLVGLNHSWQCTADVSCRSIICLVLTRCSPPSRCHR
jgi:hypothetical protein